MKIYSFNLNKVVLLYLLILLQGVICSTDYGVHVPLDYYSDRNLPLGIAT